MLAENRSNKPDLIVGTTSEPGTTKTIFQYYLGYWKFIKSYSGINHGKINGTVNGN